MSFFGPSGCRPSVAFGPEVPGWGSWHWAGEDVLHALTGDFETQSFVAWDLPRCDVVVVIKHSPPPEWIEAVSRWAGVIYCPVDAYGSAAEIDADGIWLRRCARIVIHCKRLRRYFEPFAPVEYMDHHIKYAAPSRETPRPEGNVLWVGVRSNLPPLVAWVNTNPLPAPLDVITNLEDPTFVPPPAELGFRPSLPVCIHDWSPATQVALTSTARGVIDIKGSDFRSRHKPPAKALDAMASGVPLAMNADSSPVEHLARMGFEVCPPHDVQRWFSREYGDETRRFGAAIRELLTLDRVALRYRRLLGDVLAERGMRRPGYR